MSIRRNVRLLELYTICSSMLFIVPVIVPFYKDYIGLSFREFMIGEAAFAAVVLLLEVPSGWISDIWRRKNVLALAMVFEVLGFGLLLIADNLFMAVLSQGIIGISISLFSGTNTALLYDSLLVTKEEGTYARLEGRRMGLGLYSIAAASVLGGLLYEIWPYLPILMSMAGLCGAFMCALLMEEPPRHKSAVRVHPLADMWATMKYALNGHKEVGIIIFFAAILFSGTKMIMWLQQPYYLALSVPELYFGIFMAVGYALGGFASHMGHYTERYFSNRRTLALAWGAGILVCVGAGAVLGYHGIVLLMIGGSCIYGFASPRVNDAINKYVPSDRRATILSTGNLLRQMLFIPLSFAIGWVIDDSSIQAGLLSMAVWLLFAGVMLASWGQLRERRQMRQGQPAK